ncbi:hypothetical protein MHK_000150 [Candidatus Magnetomorum sp. HK-1]|nr:hypothetical protein MHK_000150 [Candidatus Magnetomorum sp. HK-1]
MTQENKTETTLNSRRWQTSFFHHFLFELNQAGYSPEEITKFVWKPFSPEDIQISGSDRDLSFHKVETVPAEIKRFIDRLPEKQLDVDKVLNNEKIVMILLPGFTHHTLKFPAFIAQDQFKKSPIDLVHMALDPDDPTKTIETINHEGGGMKMVYAAYPRSNASSQVIIEPLFNLLHQSELLRKWVIDEEYKIVFIGYSYGTPLVLELLASINCGDFKDEFILKNTVSFLSINGDIGGSYLADAVLKEDAMVNMQKYVEASKQFNPLGIFMGLKTEQEREDLLGGVRSLAHPERQERMKWYMDKVPDHIKYFSICAFIPETDYDTNFLRNLDDWTMHKQSLASRDVSVYNDGQMVLENCFIPKFPHIPEENIIEMGAVRAHHWAVSFRTFNFGVNKFPRFPYYRALVKTLTEVGITV